MINAVLCCTFNGEKHLVSQFKSILGQIVLPDYIFIFDFNSTDDTLNIINNFDFGFNIKKIVRHFNFTPGPSLSFFKIIDFVYNNYAHVNNYFLVTKMIFGSLTKYPLFSIIQCQ